VREPRLKRYLMLLNAARHLPSFSGRNYQKMEIQNSSAMFQQFDLRLDLSSVAQAGIAKSVVMWPLQMI